MPACMHRRCIHPWPEPSLRHAAHARIIQSRNDRANDSGSRQGRRLGRYWYACRHDTEGDMRHAQRARGDRPQGALDDRDRNSRFLPHPLALKPLPDCFVIFKVANQVLTLLLHPQKQSIRAKRKPRQIRPPARQAMQPGVQMVRSLRSPFRRARKPPASASYFPSIACATRITASLDDHA